jgi:hypothetical protein
MPAEIDAPLRLFARAHQLYVRSQLGLENSAEMIEDLRLLLAETDPTETWATVGGAIFGSMALADSDPRGSHELLLRALREWPNFRDPEGRPLQAPAGVVPEKLVWGTVQGLRTSDDFEDWLTTIEALQPEGRERVFSGSDGVLGCVVFADRVVAIEAAKPKAGRDWVAALRLLERIGEHAGRLGLETLRGAALRGQIRIQAEFLKQPEEALRLVERATKLQTPIASYLPLAEAGRQMADAKRYAEARDWLSRAMREEPEGIPNEPIFVRNAASVAFGQESPKAGERYAAEALARARAEPLFPTAELAAVACAYALAVFLHRGAAAACAAWKEAARLVFSAEEDSEAWKCVFVAFAHATAHFLSIATKGMPPEHGLDGGEWATPTKESFFIRSARLAGVYQPGKRSHLRYLLGQLADWCGCDAADDWYEQARALA